VCRLTIVGAGREAWVVTLRGRGKTVCARGACPALLRGRSTSPLDARLRAVPSALRVRSSCGSDFHLGGRRRDPGDGFLFAPQEPPRLRLAHVVVGQRRLHHW